jgi:hypothetical protein
MNHLWSISPTGLAEANPDLPSVREAPKGNLFDWTSAQPAAVLQHTALTGINSVVCVGASRRDHMRAERGLLSRVERVIARS